MQDARERALAEIVGPHVFRQAVAVATVRPGVVPGGGRSAAVLEHVLGAFARGRDGAGSARLGGRQGPHEAPRPSERRPTPRSVRSARASRLQEGCQNERQPTSAAGITLPWVICVSRMVCGTPTAMPTVLPTEARVSS